MVGSPDTGGWLRGSKMRSPRRSPKAPLRSIKGQTRRSGVGHGLSPVWQSRKRPRARESSDSRVAVANYTGVDEDQNQEKGDNEDGHEEKWRPTTFSRNTLVADIPGCTSVAVKSTSRKGDCVERVPRALFDRACVLHGQNTEFPGMTSTDEEPLRPGQVFGSPGESGKAGTQYMRASRADALDAIGRGKEPYACPFDKFLELAVLEELEHPDQQGDIKAAFPVITDAKHAELFLDADRVASPVVALRIVYDSGEGQCVKPGSTVFSDPKVLFTFDQLAIGGAQNGGSGKRGASRMVVVGSQEDKRIQATAGTTTETRYVLILHLYTALVCLHRREDLLTPQHVYRENVGGLALSRGNKKVSFACFKRVLAWGNEPWWLIIAEHGNWRHCWTGPGHAALRVGACFTGYKNLAKYDAEAKGLEIGRGGDLSTRRSVMNALVKDGNGGQQKQASVMAMGGLTRAQWEKPKTEKEKTVKKKRLEDDAKGGGLGNKTLYGREKGDDGRSLSSEQGASNRPADTSVKWTGHAVEEPNNAEPASCSNCGKPRELSWFYYGALKRRVVVLDHIVGKHRCNKYPNKPRGVFKPDNEKVKTITKNGIRNAVKTEAQKVSNQASGGN